MARSLRFEYPGAFYHVMARGNGRQRIFLGDADRTLFLRTLGEGAERTGWRVHAWVLMSNHYHLVLETPEANLVAGMQWLQNAFTRRFQTRHHGWGRLFGDRYKAVPVEGAGYYYETLLDYVHLNPVRAGVVRLAEGGRLRDYPWSSVAAGYVRPPGERPAWLAVTAGLAAFGLADDARGRQAMVRRLEERAEAEAARRCGLPVAEPGRDRRRSDLREGWYWGSQAFAEKLQKLGAAVLARATHRHARSTAASLDHGEAAARTLLADGLTRLGLTPADLRLTPGSEPKKVALASEIWEKTTVNLTWLAEHLAMRSAANASQQIRRWRAARASEQAAKLPRRA